MNTSNLPSAEDIRSQQSITIVHTSLGKHQAKELLTRFGIIDTSTMKTVPMTATIYRISDSRITGYIPSKTWWNASDGEIYLLYYTSPTLPPTARPFGDKPCYAFTRLVRSNESIDYPVDTRILIDQILIEGNMYYLFLFEESQMKNILATDYDGNPWPIDVPEAALYKGEI